MPRKKKTEPEVVVRDLFSDPEPEPVSTPAPAPVPEPVSVLVPDPVPERVPDAEPKSIPAPPSEDLREAAMQAQEFEFSVFEAWRPHGLGKAIKQARERLGQSLQEVADRMFEQTGDVGLNKWKDREYWFLWLQRFEGDGGSFVSPAPSDLNRIALFVHPTAQERLVWAILAGHTVTG